MSASKLTVDYEKLTNHSSLITNHANGSYAAIGIRLPLAEEGSVIRGRYR